MPADLDHYLHALRTLHANRAGERASPREAVHAARGAGHGRSGRPRGEQDPFRPGAAGARVKFFAAVHEETDHANPHYPYFHLKTEGFWHLQPLPGRETVAVV